MKKVLLLAAVACAAITANAQALRNFTNSSVQFEKNPLGSTLKKAPAKKADLRDGQFLIGYFTDDSYDADGLGFNGEVSLEIGTEIPADFYAGLKDFKVEGIRFALRNTAEVLSVKLYGVTADDHITDVLAVKSVNSKCATGWTSVEFDEAVTVDPALSGLIPVYEFVNKRGDYAMAMNHSTTTGSFLAYGPLGQNDAMVWGNLGLDYGTPAIQMVCSAAPVEGYDDYLGDILMPNGLSANDKNGDNRISVGDITYTIDAIQKGDNNYSADDVDGVTKRLLEKRNVLVVWLSSGKEDLYYFSGIPIIKYDGDNVIIENNNGTQMEYTSDQILRITYDYIPRVK